MLHRDYFPFLPTLRSKPQGPVDHPLLEGVAPDGWWEQSASELFGSAEVIAHLLRDASDCGVPIMTPFAGFCAFSAGYINSYISYFPNMNLGRSRNGFENTNFCLEYLKEFRHVWNIADGWVS